MTDKVGLDRWMQESLRTFENILYKIDTIELHLGRIAKAVEERNERDSAQ